MYECGDDHNGALLCSVLFSSIVDAFGENKNFTINGLEG